MAVLQFVGQQRRGVAGLQKILALPQDHGGRGLSAGLRLGQHARAFDGVEGEIGAGLLLQFEAVPPGGEFIGPGLDGIDIAAGLIGHERTAPAVVAVMGHRRAAPFAVVLATPDQRGGDDVMAVAIDIRPHVDALADDALHREATAVDQRKNVFDMESATGALDSLSCFVHGDAIDMEMTSRCGCGTGDVPDIYTKPLTGHWFPGNGGDGSELPKAILFLHLENFATSRDCRVQTACRMDLFTRARELGIQTEYIDGQGHRHVTDAAALQIILDALPVRIPHRFLDQAVVVRLGAALADRIQPRRPRFPLRWKIVAGA